MKINLEPDMETLRGVARARITKAAQAERLKYTTNGKANIYRDKRAEADAWLAKRKTPAQGNKPEAVTAAALADYPFLAAEIGVTAATADELAELWQAKSVEFNTVTAPAIERREMAAKKAIAAARTPAELFAITL